MLDLIGRHPEAGKIDLAVGRALRGGVEIDLAIARAGDMLPGVRVPLGGGAGGQRQQ